MLSDVYLSRAMPIFSNAPRMCTLDPARTIRVLVARLSVSSKALSSVTLHRISYHSQSQTWFSTCHSSQLKPSLPMGEEKSKHTPSFPAIRPIARPNASWPSVWRTSLMSKDCMYKESRRRRAIASSISNPMAKAETKSAPIWRVSILSVNLLVRSSTRLSLMFMRT